MTTALWAVRSHCKRQAALGVRAAKALHLHDTPDDPGCDRGAQRLASTECTLQQSAKPLFRPAGPCRVGAAQGSRFTPWPIRVALRDDSGSGGDLRQSQEQVAPGM